MNGNRIDRRTVIKGGLFGGASLATASLLAACQQQNTSATSSGRGDYSHEEYVMVGAALTIDYWKGPRTGFLGAGKDLGVKTTIVGPSSFDQAAQVDVMNQVIARKPAGIVILPVIPTAVEDVIKKARDAGIPSISMLNGDNPGGSHLGYIGFDRAEAAATGARLIASRVSGAGTVAALVFNASVPSMIDGLRGFKDELGRLNPALNVVVGVDKADPEYGTTIASQMIQAHPDLKAFMAIDTSGGPSAARALKENGKTGIPVIGGGLGEYSTEAWPLIQSGALTAAICDPSYDEFYLAVQYLFNLNRNVGGVDWHKHKDIHMAVPRYTNVGTFVVDKSNLDAVINLKPVAA
jgi:ribose transport system substrate-binding protein